MVFAEEIADGIMTVTLTKVKSVQILAFRGMTDLHIQDRVRSIIKVKVVYQNNTQDKGELLLDN